MLSDFGAGLNRWSEWIDRYPEEAGLAALAVLLLLSFLLWHRRRRSAAAVEMPKLRADYQEGRGSLQFVEEDKTQPYLAVGTVAVTPSGPGPVSPSEAPLFDQDFSEAEISQKFGSLLSPEERPGAAITSVTAGGPRLQLVFPDLPSLWDGSAVALRRDGFFLATPTPPPLGSRFAVVFSLAAGHKLLDGEGEVINSSPQGAEIRFRSLSPEGAEVLRRIEAKNK